ncbi:MAG: EAL domain-containing protein [Burkholderiales bacterium]|nr:EAL domain-containing protein [Burkholderiales bacterium]
MNAPIPGPQEQATRLLVGQKEILEGIVAGRGLADLLTAICRLAERETSGMLCSILLLDADGMRLRHGAAPSLPFEYSRLIDGLAIGPAVGSCGTAAFRREQVIVEDIATDPLWAAYRDVAAAYRLRACWSTPIFNAARQVLGTFAMYYREPRKPSPEHAALIEMATQTAAIAIEHCRTNEKLQLSNERFLLAARATNDAVWDWDFGKNTLWWSEGITSLFGYPVGELEPGPESWTLRLHSGDAARVTAEFHAVVDDPKAQFWSAEYRFRRRDGSHAEVFDRGFVIRNSAGRAIRMIGAVQDITERKQAGERIKRQNRVHAVLSGINTLIVRVRDRQTLLDEACRIAAEQGGFGMVWIGFLDRATGSVSPAAWAGFDADEAWGSTTASARDDADGQGVTGRAIRSGQPQIVNDISTDTRSASRRRRTAAARGFRSVIALPLFIDGVVVGNFSLYAREPHFFDDEEVKLLTDLAGDISFALQYLAKEEKANYLAYYDLVTGLPNRTLFMEHLNHAMRAAGSSPGRLVLVIGDIQRFRAINETLGHSAGDETLKQVASLLRKMIRNPENLARISADCFATFLPDVRELSEVAHRIESLAAAALHTPVTVAGRELTIAFTMGAAVFPGDGADAGTLFRNAEAALHAAKSAGQRYMFYAPEMNARVAESLHLENRLRRALDLGQFVLHYQPKFEVCTRRLTGLEALIRWQDPELGLVPPASFIPLMEETGLILEVGQWALQRAIKDHRGWSARGLRPPRVAVNVSSIQLRQRDFVDIVKRAVSGFAGGEVALDLEITESVIMENMAEMTLKLQSIHALGLRIAMDDFGTGYSSLSCIAQLPINTLKIDRSFVIEMARSDYHRNIVTMIIQLAHALRLDVVAEGVDAEEQVRILDRLGCDSMQGYLLSKPLPPEDIETLLETLPHKAGAD